MKTVIIGPTGSHLRTVNVATGASGATGVWETVHYTVSGPSGSFETVQVASSRDIRFRSLAIPGFTGTVTPDPAPVDTGGGGGGGGDVALLLETAGNLLLETGDALLLDAA